VAAEEDPAILGGGGAWERSFDTSVSFPFADGEEEQKGRRLEKVELDWGRSKGMRGQPAECST
jgi:hypothetical protein